MDAEVKELIAASRLLISRYRRENYCPECELTYSRLKALDIAVSEGPGRGINKRLFTFRLKALDIAVSEGADQYKNEYLIYSPPQGS